jgi:hypothetical protein
MIYKIIVLLACALAVTAKTAASNSASKKDAVEKGHTTTITSLEADDNNGDDKNPTTSGATQNCASISSDGVRALFKSWGDSLLTTPDQVVSHYWHNSNLIPTLSNVIRDTDSTKLAYFEHFCAKKPVPLIYVQQLYILKDL